MKMLKHTEDLIIFEKRPTLKNELFGYIGSVYKKHPFYYTVVLILLLVFLFIATRLSFTMQNIILVLSFIPVAFILMTIYYYIFVYPFPLRTTLDRKNNIIELEQFGLFQNNKLTIPLDQIISVEYQPARLYINQFPFHPSPQNQINFYLKSQENVQFISFLKSFGYAVVLSETAQSIGEIISVPVKQAKHLI